MLTHIDDENLPCMVDVSKKKVTYRQAHARSQVLIPKELKDLLCRGEIVTKKGPVFQTAIIAGTMAVKKTSELIPFCHSLPLENCKINISLDEEILIDCFVGSHHRTGVEMEALLGASIAALTVYDMCKAVSHHIVIKDTRLISKTGGKSDFKCDT